LIWDAACFNRFVFLGRTVAPVAGEKAVGYFLLHTVTAWFQKSPRRWRAIGLDGRTLKDR
jgi:hypothetical protein